MDKKQHSKSTASGSSSSSTTNKPKKISSSTTAASVSTMGRSGALLQPARRIIQNFLLVWLDVNIDESKEDFQNTLKQLRRIVASVTTFTDAQQCFDYLSGITKEKAFMIVSGSLGQKIAPEMEAIPQLETVYVFCSNQSYHEQWTNKVPKIKGVYTKIEPICEALQIDRRNCDRGMISISFNRIDPLFMYTQLLKEALLEIEDDDAKSIKELVEYCRLYSDASEITLEKIEREYRDHTPIWWYTGPYFIYSMLNRGLRQMDVDIILKMGFFIRHLHQHITDLHREQKSSKAAMPSKFQVFRGQGLSMEAFEKMKKTKVCHNMGEYAKALSSYERSLEIQKVALPPNHPDLAASYNNIGLVYNNMGEYSKALSSYERSLEIQKIALPPNHPDFAQSYNNIGMVYYNMGEGKDENNFKLVTAIVKDLKEANLTRIRVESHGIIKDNPKVE
ncbi:unnamed protein product [Rotaria sordida]|uniref:Uncharacterized protein n=1 Tax=Rotaria sordida TaxID=392033 RepID=A0A818SN45_9BILA|nr:unnamed protein product [Rotaria sordida]